MRKLILTAAAALFAMAAPTVASAQTGYVDVAYSNSDADFLSGDVESTSLGGSFTFGTGAAIDVQVDARIANIEADTGGDVDAVNIGAHLFNRGPTWLWGGYIGYTNLDGSGTDADDVTVAVETQYYMARSTISGALSYSENEDFLDLNVTMLEGEFRHFTTDNFSLAAGVGIGSAEAGSTDLDLWSANIGAEYQLATMPLSIFAGWRHTEVDAPGGDLENDSLGLGIRWNFGGGTLFDRNRSGAGLNRVPGASERLLGNIVI